MTTPVNITSTHLVIGDPLNPCVSDVLTQVGIVDTYTAVPSDWNILDGNHHTSTVGRTLARWQVEQQMSDEEEKTI